MFNAKEFPLGSHVQIDVIGLAFVVTAIREPPDMKMSRTSPHVLIRDGSRPSEPLARRQLMPLTDNVNANAMALIDLFVTVLLCNLTTTLGLLAAFIAV